MHEKRWALLACSLTLAACQPLQGPTESQSDHSAWSHDELEWFTHHDARGSCLALPESIGVETPLAEATSSWQRIRAGYGLAQEGLEHPVIERELQRFRRHPHYFTEVTRRAEPYLHYIVERLVERGMPTELALLPFIESAYDPFAYSQGRAAGLWQFVPGTASHFGLKRNGWYDARRDIVVSTETALNYLQQLHARFDRDWLLALAAYNGGPGTVSRAIRRNAAQGREGDFWSLALPAETRTYVPRLLALARIVRTPSRYGLALHPIPNQPYFAAVDIGGQLDLARAAEWAGVDIEELSRLNPAFNRWATDPEGPHRLLLPVARADALAARLATAAPEERMRWTMHQVRPGDSLIRIARRHGVEVAGLRVANELDGDMIRVGQQLRIPLASEPTAAQSDSVSRYHTVRSGDSLWAIGRQHGVSIDQLARWNGLRKDSTLRSGQTLRLSGPTEGGPPGASALRQVNYQVRSGDSLARIAARFRVGVGDIVQWNTLDPGRYLQPGQQLTLHVDITRPD